MTATLRAPTMPRIQITPSQPPESILGSRIPPPPTDALKDVEGLLARLRAEAAGADDNARKARLLYEIGEIEERAGDEPAAARDYLAAFNMDGTFREPVEGLLRLLERRRSLRNLGKLVEALGRGAETPEEQVRAKTLRAYFLEDVGGDAEAAKQAAIEATTVEGASEAETATAWLTLELIAARVGDTSTRVRALSMRPALARDPTWRSLLRIDTAKLEAAAGNIDGALETLRAARAEGAGATFAAAVAAERLARRSTARDGNGADRPAAGDGPEATSIRMKAYAEALEVQAALIDEAMTSPTRGDALGVPRWARSSVTMVERLASRGRGALALVRRRRGGGAAQSRAQRPDAIRGRLGEPGSRRGAHRCPDPDGGADRRYGARRAARGGAARVGGHRSE